MLYEWPDEKTIVNRMAIRGSGLDAILSGQRLNFLLNHTGLHPAGLPSSAILCIRHLPDPLPGTLRLEKAGELMPTSWEKALVGKLEQLRQQAARPIQGPISSAAEAIIFNNQAELLVCLAEDWQAGQLRTHWWWQSLLGKLIAPDLQIIQAWQDAPEYVPAALQLLSQKGNLLPFIQKWEAVPAQVMLQRLAQRFALPEIEQVLPALFSDIVVSSSNTIAISNQIQKSASNQGNQAFTEFSEDTSGQAELEDFTRWQIFAPESRAANLTIVQAGLLGIGLTLYRAPQKLRTPAFAQAIAAWATSRQVSKPESKVVLKKPSNFTPRFEPDINGSIIANPVSSKNTEPVSQKSPLFSTNPVFGQTEQMENVLPTATPSPKAEIKLNFEVATLEVIEQLGQVVQEQADSPAPAFEAFEFLANGFNTEYAGLFYLINLGLFLELYGDFTSPMQPGLALPIWDFVALLGDNLAGKGLYQDKVWSLLANLANRAESEKPGQNFEPPESWRIPPEWLKPFPEKNWTWTFTANRLRVKHPAGFLILDVPLLPGISPPQQLQQELAVYGKRQVRKGKSRLEEKIFAANGLEQWLNWLLPYVKARLGRALGTTPGKAGKMLCRQTGRVILTEGHLTVKMKLGELPLEVRLAGLDRDPGWVPAAGRYIAFIFE